MVSHFHWQIRTLLHRAKDYIGKGSFDVNNGVFACFTRTGTDTKLESNIALNFEMRAYVASNFAPICDFTFCCVLKRPNSNIDQKDYDS